MVDNESPGRQSETDRKQTSDISKLDKRVERRERITLAVAVVGVLIAGASVYVSERQRQIMQRQFDDARKGAEESNIVINRQLAIAENQAASMKALAESNQRFERSMNRTALTAGVICEPPLNVAEPPPVGRVWTVAVELYNMYSRPASEVTVRAVAEAVARNKRPTFGRRERLIVEGSNIPREASLRTDPLAFVDASGRAIGTITESFFESVAKGRTRLFVYGDVSYVDAGGCHRQEFCSVFDPTIKTGGPVSVQTGAWMSCSFHNAETECDNSSAAPRR